MLPGKVLARSSVTAGGFSAAKEALETVQATTAKPSIANFCIVHSVTNQMFAALHPAAMACARLWQARNP
jgi:hypothetical protein